MNGWFKFHRKLIENPLFHDEKALRVFLWILSNVNYKTGTMTCGRFWAAKMLNYNPNTFYLTLQRLSKRYKVISLKSTNKYTTISVPRWALYQSGQNDNNKITTKNNDIRLSSQDNFLEENEENGKQQQQNNNKITHTKELRSKEERNNIYIIADKQQSDSNGVKKEITVHKRKPPEKQTQLQRICYFLEDTLETTIVTWGKQAKALDMMLKSGYTEGQIKLTIKKMSVDDFWGTKGFDLMSVANHIHEYKSQGKRMLRYQTV